MKGRAPETRRPCPHVVARRRWWLLGVGIQRIRGVAERDLHPLLGVVLAAESIPRVGVGRRCDELRCVLRSGGLDVAVADGHLDDGVLGLRQLGAAGQQRHPGIRADDRHGLLGRLRHEHRALAAEVAVGVDARQIRRGRAGSDHGDRSGTDDGETDLGGDVLDVHGWLFLSLFAVGGEACYIYGAYAYRK